MIFPTTIKTTVGQSLITKIGRFFNGSVSDCLAEIIQNSRRAGATRIDIARIEKNDRPVLRIRDDGRGIAEPAKFLTLGDPGGTRTPPARRIRQAWAYSVWRAATSPCVPTQPNWVRPGRRPSPRRMGKR
jgi:hypothetical protein